MKIEVIRDDFVMGSPENPWPGVFGGFLSGHPRAYRRCPRADCGGFLDDRTDRAASEVVLLDAMQKFFSYELHTRCGIPSITLEGTAQDWSSITRRMRALRDFDLDWWVDPLEPILE